jgi:HJR/Mrr/RecB family endonuclease
MLSFRAYPISNNRKVAAAPSVIIVCENDQDGLRQAQQLANDNDVELWDGPRFIARLKPLQESQESSKESH